MATLASYLDLALRATYTNSNDLANAVQSINSSFADELSNGTGAVDTADMLFADQRTLAATTENLDLAGGLTDVFGNTLTFARIKLLLVHNTNTTAGNNLKIGGAASNAFLLFDNATDIKPVGPNGIALFWEPSAAGMAVTASTGDILKMDAGASTIVYKIVIIGSSA